MKIGPAGHLSARKPQAAAASSYFSAICRRHAEKKFLLQPYGAPVPLQEFNKLPRVVFPT